MRSHMTRLPPILRPPGAAITDICQWMPTHRSGALGDCPADAELQECWLSKWLLVVAVEEGAELCARAEEWNRFERFQRGREGVRQ